MKEGEIGWICGSYVGDRKFMQDLSGNASRKEMASKTQEWRGG